MSNEKAATVDADVPQSRGIRRVSATARVAQAVLCQAFVVYVATNMMVCAIVFAPWALPRETVSGLLGRWETRLPKRSLRRYFAIVATAIVDRLYFWEPNHCVEVFLCEHDARRVLYPEKPGAKP